MVDFRVFSSKIVHAKLTEAGYDPPSLRTVARWTSSGKAPAWAEQAMRDLLSLGTGPPPWAEALIADVAAIRQSFAHDPPGKEEGRTFG